MSLAFNLARPILHCMDAERAHHLTIAGLKALPTFGAKPISSPSLKRKVFGLDFPNPIGLAAGFDKNAQVPDAILAQGFGFVEIGTVTPQPQSGNPKPRLFRLAKDRGVINRMGFNNEGHDVVFKRLEARASHGGIVGVNIGANKDTEDRIADYVLGIKRFERLASYITINVSSPNTPGLRNLQGKQDLQQLLDRANQARQTKTPMLLKIAPDLTDDDLQDIAECCLGGSVDGVIISNTTISRQGLKSKLASEAGGMSGLPLLEFSTLALRKFHQITAGKIPLIGVGGIHDENSARAKLEAGASLIQLYSALVYQGPKLVKDICASLNAT